MKKHLWLALAFLVIMLDSLINYLLSSFFRPLPINAVVPVLLVAAFLRHGPRHLMPPPYYSLLLMVAVGAYSLAILTAPGTSPHRIFELFGAASAFITGYALFKNVSDERTIGRLFAVIGWSYVVLCTIALLHLWPQYFPTKVHVWSLQGKLIERPEVTTDQNFQIFYLMPLIALIALPSKWLRFGIITVGLAGALFVLAKLQTRSGVLVAMGVALLGLIMPIRMRSLGRQKLILLPAVLIVGAFVAAPIIHNQIEALLERFFDTDYQTGLGRLYSFLYLFEKLGDPSYWIPRGNAEFIARTGDVPHSNITAALLEGGVLGLVTWILLIPVPLALLVRLFWKRRLDHSACLVLVMGAGMFVIQMSLNVPFVDQIWLWSGAVIGCLSRIRSTRRVRAPLGPLTTPLPARSA